MSKKEKLKCSHPGCEKDATVEVAKTLIHDAPVKHEGRWWSNSHLEGGSVCGCEDHPPARTGHEISLELRDWGVENKVDVDVVTQRAFGTFNQ